MEQYNEEQSPIVLPGEEEQQEAEESPVDVVAPEEEQQEAEEAPMDVVTPEEEQQEAEEAPMDVVTPEEEQQEAEEAPLSVLTPEDLEPPRETGHVKWFNDVRSYGFIEREGKDDVFVHMSNINHEPPTLDENDRVEFTVVSTEKGLSAEDVDILTKAI